MVRFALPLFALSFLGCADETVSGYADPDAIENTTMVWSPRRESLDRVKELAELGVHRLCVAPPTSNPAKIRDAMEELAETIAPVATR